MNLRTKEKVNILDDVFYDTYDNLYRKYLLIGASTTAMDLQNGNLIDHMNETKILHGGGNNYYPKHRNTSSVWLTMMLIRFM